MRVAMHNPGSVARVGQAARQGGNESHVHGVGRCGVAIHYRCRVVENFAKMPHAQSGWCTLCFAPSELVRTFAAHTAR